MHGDAECKLFAALASRTGSSNPAVRRLQRRRQAARSLETSVSRSFWPTLSVLGKAEVEYPHAMKLEFGPLLSAGVALEWRLFDGFLRSHRAAQHRAEVRGIGRQEQAAVEQLHRRLRDLAARSGAARARLSAAKDLLRQSELQLKVARAAAQSGAATHLDRRAAELARDSAQVGVRRALMELCLIQAGELRVRGVDMVSVAASTDGRTGEEP